MSDVLTRITACHDKNAGIISRIEASRGVRPFTYSIEWPSLSAADIDESKHDLLQAKVQEFQHENVATLLEDWSFPGTLRTDFAPFIRRALTWNASTWDEIKTLNGDMKDFASSLGDSCKIAHGELPEIIEGELRKLIENFERIEAALSAFERDIAGGRSRREALQREVSQKAREFSNFIVQKGFRLPPLAFTDSSILTAAASQQQKLSSWYPGGWTLIYRGSRDGLNAASFHARVDGKGPTLTIIQSGANIFGGYAAVPWKGSGGYVADNAASLFLLKSAQGVEPQQFSLNQASARYALYHHSTSGPTFGGGHDLTCFPHGAQSYSNLNHTYLNSLGANTLAGGRNFNPSEIEVFEQTRADRGRGQTPASSGSRWFARSRSARRAP